MEILPLESLLALYAAQSANTTGGVLTPSSTTPSELAQIAADLGITLPADYRALILRYNLAAVEVNFSRFYPPVVRPMGLSAALTVLLTSGEYPFAEAYRIWGVAPVGDDAWQQELVLAIRQPTDPRSGQPHERTGPLAPTRPYGSVWAFSPDEMYPTLDGAFTFVGSSFTQTLQMALYCWYAPRLAQEQSTPHLRETTLREALTAIDPNTQGAPYWQLWIDAALEGP